MVVGNRNCRSLTEEVLLNSPFRDKEKSCGKLASARIFRGLDKSLEEVRKVVRFSASLWASVNQTFCSY